jgi:hypothetical protein
MMNTYMNYNYANTVQDQWRTQEFFSGGGGDYARNFFLWCSKNSVEDRGQTDRGSRGSSPLVRGSTRFANE